jgi:hypothetical protein
MSLGTFYPVVSIGLGFRIVLSISLFTLFILEFIFMTVSSFNSSFAVAPQFARQTPPSLEQRQAMFTQLAGRSGDANLLELSDISGTPLEKSPIAMGLQQEGNGVSFETLETKMQQAFNGRSQFGGQLNFAQGAFPFAQGFNNGGSTGFPPIPPFAQGFNNINGNRGGQSLPSLEEAQSKFQQLAGSDGLLQSSELKNANIPFADMIAQGIKQKGGSVSFETVHNKMEELRQSYPAHNGQPPFAQGFNNGVGSGFPFAQGGNMPQFPAFAQGFNGGLFLN